MTGHGVQSETLNRTTTATSTVEQDVGLVVQNSFKAVKSWIRELKQYADADIVVAITGNKCDLEDLREIQYKGFQSFVCIICN